MHKAKSDQVYNSFVLSIMKQAAAWRDKTVPDVVQHLHGFETDFWSSVSLELSRWQAFQYGYLRFWKYLHGLCYSNALLYTSFSLHKHYDCCVELLPTSSTKTLRSLYISELLKFIAVYNRIFQCMGKTICVEFQRNPFKFSCTVDEWISNSILHLTELG